MLVLHWPGILKIGQSPLPKTRTEVHKNTGLNITRLDGRLERLEGNLVGEIGRIESKLGVSIDRLEGRLSGNSDRLESKIALLAKDVSSLKAYVARNTTDIAWIKQKMGGPS